MNNTTNEKKVLSCIDGSSFSEAVCDYSIWIAKIVEAPLTFLHTIEQPKVPVVADLSGAIGLGASEDLLNELTAVEQTRGKLLIEKGSLMLQAAKEKAIEANVSEIKTRQRHGTLTEALVELEDSIRVLVVGISGEQHENKVGVGSQLETVIRSLHKPILVVNKSFSLPKKIMLAYDGGDSAKKALDMIISSPLFKSIPCHLVHVVNDENHVANDALLQEAEEKLNAIGVDVTSITLTGKIEEVLADYQAKNDIDLTLMGAFSHNRVRDFLLGSFTAKMLETTQRPLLLLR